MTDEIAVCPHCDTSNIEPQTRGDYRCKKCKRTFETPAYRDPRHPTRGSSHGLARILERADVTSVDDLDADDLGGSA